MGMTANCKHDLRAICRHFDIPGDFVSAEPYGNGHINDTYAATFNTPETGIRRYILQRINHNVFKDPVRLMDNVRRVTEHQHRKLLESGASDPHRRALTLIPTRENLFFHRNGDGNTWRTYLFIENANSHDKIQSPEQAYQAARAFGEFQKQLVDLPGERLFETIPNFHNTPNRFETLLTAVEADTQNRAREARNEIAFAIKHRQIAGILLDLHRKGLIPERITHNDTKMNNVMLDPDTSEGICIIDLDTVMPGLALYDFGDMVRSATNSAPEDERDLSQVNANPAIFQALVNGYLTSTHAVLTPNERANLTFSGKLISFEIGIRFLTDFLQGDIYFKIKRPGHNLDRCRSQFKMVESIAAQEDAMTRIVDSWSPSI